jgi:hypothetical protein
MAAPGLQIPSAFRDSYDKFDAYPTNILLKTTYPLALKAHAVRLGNLKSRLFHKTQCFVPFHDFTGIGMLSPLVLGLPLMSPGPNAGIHVKNIANDSELKEWLGDYSRSTPHGGIATKPDPKCRYMYVGNFNSIDLMLLTTVIAF